LLRRLAPLRAIREAGRIDFETALPGIQRRLWLIPHLLRWQPGLCLADAHEHMQPLSHARPAPDQLGEYGRPVRSDGYPFGQLGSA